MTKYLSLTNRLKQYAATGAAFLLAAPISQASVVYTDVDPDMTYNVSSGSVFVDLDNSGSNDIRLLLDNKIFTHTDGYGGFASFSEYTQLYAYGIGANGAERNVVSYGVGIGSSLSFRNFAFIGGAGWGSNGTFHGTNGSLSSGISAYLPVRFDIAGATHYGYVHLEFIAELNNSRYIIKEYAYETVPDTPIGAGATTTLPVELSLFKAQAQEELIHLVWQTETEIENAGFEIQRATENFEWETIAWQEGHGTTTQQQKYAYDDRDLRKGAQYYYRLKQIGIDGLFAYSDIVSASLRVDQLLVGPVTPNPIVKGQASIEIISPKSKQAAISIFSSDGKLMSHENIEIQDSRTLHQLDLQGLATGIYFLKVVTEKESAYQKIVVK